MSEFNKFSKLDLKYKILFESSFNKLYKKKYFGEIEKDEARLRLLDWFIKFIKIVENKEEEELIVSLCTINSKENYIWFESLTGYNLKNKTNKLIKETIISFCKE